MSFLVHAGDQRENTYLEKTLRPDNSQGHAYFTEVRERQQH